MNNDCRIKIEEVADEKQGIYFAWPNWKMYQVGISFHKYSNKHNPVPWNVKLKLKTQSSSPFVVQCSDSVQCLYLPKNR